MIDSQSLSAWKALVDEGHILTMTATEAQSFMRLVAAALESSPKKS